MATLFRRTGLCFLLLLLNYSILLSQEDAGSVLDLYVEEGLRNNLALKQKNFSFLKSLQTVRQAKSLFYPSLSLEARYSIARGGRSEEIPVGDLVNPVYQSLNALLDAAENFPGMVEIPDTRFPEAIPNESIDFLRPTDQETKLRLIQPVFQPEIMLRRQMALTLSDIKKSEKEVYERELTAAIKKAYYQYSITTEVKNIIKDGLALVGKHLERAETLVRLRKSTTYPVYRIEAEKSNLEADLAETDGNIQTAKAYFNFLLNRPLEDSIILQEIDDVTLEKIQLAESYIEQALRSRGELTQLELGLQAADQNRKLEARKKLPTLAAVVDYGFQGEQYRFTRDDDFFIGSLVLQWNIFSGFRRDAATEEAKLELKSLEVRQEEAVGQVRLEVIRHYNILVAARKRLNAVRKQADSARRSFDLVNALYRNEKATLLDWLDGRTLLTNSRKEVVVKKYEYLIQWSEFQRVIGL